MAPQKRSYEMKRRAEQQERTRLRIVESAVHLHGTLGPSRTSVSAVARRAGVRRSTVYRHFPDELSLYRACTSHWEAANAPPDLERWAEIGDPGERLQTALGELYRHYRRTQGMMENVLRDEETMPTVRQMLRGYRAYLAEAADTLLAGRPMRGATRRRVAASVAHALSFATWRSLGVDNGLTDDDAADLMCRLVGSAAVAPPRAA